MLSTSCLIRSCAVAALVVCGLAFPASARQLGPRGVGTPAVRLELRIVPQRGAPGDATGVVDLPGTMHDDITMAGAGVSRRFEVQYRLIDNISTDLIVPAGLRSAVVSVTATGPGVGGTGAGQLARARLSVFEAELAGATPPTSPDLSGATAPLVYTGLHRPFRDGIPAPAPNNDALANGGVQIDGRAISGIMPLANTPSGQNAAEAWYGLYSFDLLAVGVLPGTITLVATPEPELGTGNRFSYWAQNEATPRLSPAGSAGSASVLSIVPGPGAGIALVIAAATTRRRMRG